MTTWQAKRIYDDADDSDGHRILVDRIWPRGVAKAAAQLDDWPKFAAPSTGLRKFLHDDREGNWKEFQELYREELDSNDEVLELAKKLHEYGTVTLLTAAKDLEHCHVPVLMDWLKKRH